MKRLMVTLSAVALAFGLRAADAGALSGTSFETDETGKYTTDAGWTVVEDEGRTLTVTEYDGETQAQTRPSLYRGEDQNKYLAVKTTFGKPVTRKVNEAGTQQIGDGVYFDSLVKLTACDVAPEADAYADAKIMVWAQTNEEETETKLYVKAGKMNEDGRTVTAEVYDCGSFALCDKWVRLTIKAINSITKSGTIPGFVVFVNESVKGTTEDVGLDNVVLTDSAAEFEKDGALFPSLVQGGTAAVTAIAGVGIDGQGGVDDLVFTTTAPDFAKDSEFFTVTAGEKVVSFTANGAASQNGVVKVQYTGAGMTVTIADVVCAAGYMSDGLDTDAEEGVEIDDMTFTVSDKGLSGTVNAQPVGATFNGESFASVADAVEAANEITVAGDYTLKLLSNAADGIEIENTTEGVNLTIDLAGKTVTQGAKAVAAISITEGSYVTIIDSVGGGVVVANTELKEPAAVYGSCTINAGKYNGMVMGDVLYITGGQFLKTANEGLADAATFPEGKTLVDDATAPEYWVIGDVLKHSVIFIVGTDTVKTVEVAEGEAIEASIKPADPTSTKAWESFQGWFNGETAFEFGTNMGTADITLNAKFQFLPTDSEGNFLVATEGDLVKLQKYVAGGQSKVADSFKQTADIAMTAAFTGIGTYKNGSGTQFKGTYDGNDKQITNLVFTPNGNNYQGLFNEVCDATVKNLTVVLGAGDPLKDKAGNVIATKSAFDLSGYDYANPTEFGGAAMVGCIKNSSFIGCTTKGDIAGTHNVGGFAVRLHTNAIITDCTNEVNVVGTYTKVAGLVVLTQQAGDVITRCVNKGSVAAKGTTCLAKDAAPGCDGVAGILGYSNTAIKIDSCENTGAITTEATGTSGTVGGKTDEMRLGSIVGMVSAVVTLDGTNVVRDDVRSIGSCTATIPAGAAFATVNDGVATLGATPVLDGSYKVMANGASYEFTEAGSITFDSSLVSAFEPTATGDLVVTHDGNVWTAAVPAAKEVKPGEAFEIEAANQADADAIAAKYTVVAFDAEAEAAGQVAVLKAVAVKVGEKFVVQTAIDTAAPAYKAPEVAVPAVADSLADIASGEATTVTVAAENVTPGLYYSIDAATEVNGTYLEGGRALATSAGVTLTVTKPAGNKAFFKVSEHMEPTPAN